MEKQNLIDLISIGHSTWKIAEILKTTQPNVRYWLKKYNLQTQRSFDKLINQKTCPSCKISKPLPEFYTSTKSSSFCKACIKISGKNRQRIAKQKAVDYKGGCCSNCGYDKSLAALEFHHIDPATKDSDWNNYKRVFSDKYIKELDKCVLLCSNCHRELHEKLNIER